MIRKKITTDDFVTSKYTHKRFGEEVECKPISTYFKAGLLKDYKNLNTDAEVLFFDGLKTPGDAGQGIYRKVYINAVEDIGVYIKINNHLYKRQFTGAVNLGWFGDDSAAIRTALKYGFIRFERKHYELEYDAYILTNNVKIDLNGATITIKGTPLYGFFFRVNDYILKIFNGTIKAHKGITNIARFNNASAITTDFRTNIEFLDLEGNELEEHQIPQTNEILYRGKRLVINGRKHFNGNNRTLRVKSGLAAPTEKNQLVPASYEVPEFDYSNIWKSNVDATIVGIKTFTNFQYTKESISIFQAPATKSALEYYLQVYKSQIESQLVNKFIIGTYFKLNAYYISCEVYKEEINPDTPDAAPTLVVDDTYTPNVNALFNQTRFTQFKSRSVQSVFEWGVGDYKKYKWVINKRIFSKDNYTFIFVKLLPNSYTDYDIYNIFTDIPESDYNNNMRFLESEYWGYEWPREYTVTIINGMVTLLNTSTTLVVYINNKVMFRKTYKSPDTFSECSNKLIQQNFYSPLGVYRKFPAVQTYKYLQLNEPSQSVTKQIHNIIYNMCFNNKKVILRLKQYIFNNVVYQYATKKYSVSGGSSVYNWEFSIQGNFAMHNKLAYSFVTYMPTNQKVVVLSCHINKNNYMSTITGDDLYRCHGFAPGNRHLFTPVTTPDLFFVGNLSTGEPSLEEMLQQDLTLHNKKHKFIQYNKNDLIGCGFIYNSDIPYVVGYEKKYFINTCAALNITEIIQYFDIAILPEDKTKEDYTYEELEKMIINPT